MNLSIKRLQSCFVIRDENGYSRGHFYFENDSTRAMITKLPTEEDARRAAQIAARALQDALNDPQGC